MELQKIAKSDYYVIAGDQIIGRLHKPEPNFWQVDTYTDINYDIYADTDNFREARELAEQMAKEFLSQ